MNKVELTPGFNYKKGEYYKYHLNKKGSEIGYINFTFSENGLVLLERIEIYKSFREHNGYGKKLLGLFNDFLLQHNFVGVLQDTSIFPDFYISNGWKKIDTDIYIFNIHKVEELKLQIKDIVEKVVGGFNDTQFI